MYEYCIDSMIRVYCKKMYCKLILATGYSTVPREAKPTEVEALGRTRGFGGRSPPMGSRGNAPVGGMGNNAPHGKKNLKIGPFWCHFIE